jgi:hypothetical protein
MPKIDKFLQQQPREVARQVISELDRRERLQKAAKSVYDGSLSWKKVSGESEHHKLAKYQDNQPGLSSLVANPNRKLNII